MIQFVDTPTTEISDLEADLMDSTLKWKQLACLLGS